MARRRAPAGSRRPPDPPRRLAFDALRAVNAGGGYANLVLSRLLSERRLTGRDAAFATELVAGTCRLAGTYDLVLAAAAGRALTSLQPAVVDLLRLGAHQQLAMRVPTHAAVASTVDLAAATVGERVTGLVNAVLRKVATRTWQEWLRHLTRDLDERGRLGVVTAHPRWVVDAYADLLPAAELERALAANNVEAPVTLAVRPGLGSVEELLGLGATPGRHSPYAALWSGNPGDLAAVRAGRVGVQDEGSQLAALGLARAEAPPGRWLDLCAGPGGKTALLAGLAGLAHPSQPVLATDAARHRAELVGNAVRAYPRDRVSVAVVDGTRPAWRPGTFARVLADVPCSGLGALRRRPESRWRRQAGVVDELHPLQVALLRAALAAAAPGAVVAYVTCSPHRHETRDVLAEVTDADPGVSLLDAATLLPEVADAAADGYLQLWPHRHGTDGMFAAYLRVGVR